MTTDRQTYSVTINGMTLLVRTCWEKWIIFASVIRSTQWRAVDNETEWKVGSVSFSSVNPGWKPEISQFGSLTQWQQPVIHDKRLKDIIYLLFIYIFIYYYLFIIIYVLFVSVFLYVFIIIYIWLFIIYFFMYFIIISLFILICLFIIFMYLLLFLYYLFVYYLLMYLFILIYYIFFIISLFILLFVPTDAHTYIYIYITILNYITNSSTCFCTSAPSSGSFDIVFGKFIKHWNFLYI
jgi:hypothetical protein